MSSPAEAGPSAPKSEKVKSGLGKLLARAKTVLKKSDGSKRFSLSGISKPVAKSEEPAPKEAAKEETAAVPEGATRVKRTELFEERAKQLGERFGLEIQPSEWHQAEGDALRIEKPIRMRVRRACHKCEAIFGIAKECPNCNHVRCTKCIRYPPKRSDEEKQASRERRAALLKAKKENPPIEVDWRPETGPIVLKKKCRPCTQDRVYRTARQRVRRTCHECSTIFSASSKTCQNCGHVRCTDCPREPSKKKKYPFGYPGDEFGPNAVPHHACFRCETIYPGGAPDGTECKKCKYPKDDKCPRLKPRKVEPEPDPDIVRSLEEKLASTRIE